MARQAPAKPTDDADLRPQPRAAPGAAPALPNAAPGQPATRKYLTTTPGSWLGPLKVKFDGSVLQLQPLRHPSEKVPSLVVDLKTGHAGTCAAPILPDDSPCVLGVIGMVKLGSGTVLALITKAKRVTGAEESIYHVTETQLITHEAVKGNPTDLRHAALLQEALDVKEAGRHMYFSHKSPLVTLTTQRIAAAAASAGPVTGGKGTPKAGGKARGSNSLWAKADPRFVWNTRLAKLLLDAGVHAFITPVMVGYVGQVQDAALPSVDGSVQPQGLRLRATLITRMASERSGTLSWRRGCDTKGACAHLMETELRVEISRGGDDGDGGGGAPDRAPTSTHSFVQLRGDVPLLWAAHPDLSPEPPPKLCPDPAAQAAAASAHVSSLTSTYQAVTLLHVPGGTLGPGSGVTHRLVSALGGGAGSAAPPAATPDAAVLAVAGPQPGEVTWHALGGTAAPGVTDVAVTAAGGTAHPDPAAALMPSAALRSRLIAALEQGALESHGWFRQVEGAGPQQEQAGVVRTSAPGPIDLTNLLQWEVATRWLERVLQSEGLLGEGQSLRSSLPSLDKALRTVWANQGTVLGDQVTSAGCASSAWVEAGGGGELSTTAKLGQLLSNCYRWYARNFSEAQRQDVTDIVTGAYKMDPGVKPVGRAAGRYTALQVAVVSFCWAVLQVAMMLFAGEPVSLGNVLYYVGIPSTMAALLIGWVRWRQPKYCPRPLLAPELVYAWPGGALP